MRIKYFVSYHWYSQNFNIDGTTRESGVGRLEVFFDRHISGAADLEQIEQLIAGMEFHQNKNNKIVVTNWQRFETPIRDRKISRLALAKGLR